VVATTKAKKKAVDDAGASVSDDDAYYSAEGDGAVTDGEVAQAATPRQAMMKKTADADVCAHCGGRNPAKSCGRCKLIKYCSAPCQRAHWPAHKYACLAPEDRAVDLFGDKYLSENAKRRVFTALVLSILIFGYEVWYLREGLLHRL
jgi:ribosomal protein L40E